MIDEQFQSKGHGRKAMLIEIEGFRAEKDIRAVAISYEPHNTGAKNYMQAWVLKRRAKWQGMNCWRL